MFIRFLFYVALLARGLHASIQYPGGTIVNTTYATDGSRQNLASAVEDALNTAGWTTISGHHTATIVVRSASTPTASNSIDVKITDPGSGTCTQVKMQNAAATKVSQAYFLNPTSGKTYKLVGNKYQMTIWTAGTTPSREFLMFGTLYIPSFLNSVITG